MFIKTIFLVLGIHIKIKYDTSIAITYIPNTVNIIG